MANQTYCLLLCFLIACAGCAGLGPSSQLPPSSVGIDTSIEKLASNFNDYEAYYSAKLHNPSAILFVPKKSEYRLRLHWKWRPIKNTSLLHRLRNTIDKIYPSLSAVMTPQKKESGKRGLLAFIYTPDYAALHKTGKPKTYFLNHVPVQPHPDFHLNGDGNGK